MWRWLHPYAKPEVVYHLLGRWQPWLAGAAALTLGLGLVWGLAFAPADYQQGDSYRIIFVHVPTAMFSMSLYVALAISAFVGRVWQLKMADWALAAIAPVGVTFTFISLVTGAIWGKPMWGTWWEWDARLTSQLILFFLYVGVLALYHAFSDQRNGAKAAGILAMVGVINIPIIRYSVEWWNTLHQGATLTVFERPPMANSMLVPLLVSILGFGLLAGALIVQRMRNEILRQELRRPWVKVELSKELTGELSKTEQA